LVFCILYNEEVTELVVETDNQIITSEIASRICLGDIAAYEQFVRSQWRIAVHACWLVLRNNDDAEEAAQDAFVSLYKSRGQLKNPDKFHTWFYRILLNSAHQRWRNRPHTMSSPEREVPDPEDQIGQTDTKITVRGALHCLSQPERTALVLCYFCGLTDREGSFAAGWPLGTYKWRLAKARRHLLRRLQENGCQAPELDL
jgi:RNA polymerase sigma-70 factor (ECF subfamily)